MSSRADHPPLALRAACLGLLLVQHLPAASAEGRALAVVSLEGATLRLETGRERRVFPVSVGRLLPDGREPAAGLFYTGPDPSDRRFYLPSRHEPAFHQGLPFLRLDRRSGGSGATGGQAVFGIHGPVTPSLIWGRVSAGCIRMAPQHLRWLYAFALQHPGLPLRLVAHPDEVNGFPVTPTPDRPAPQGCPEAGVGVRQLRRAPFGSLLHDRVCARVDHWWAVELKGGERLRARLQHGGGLRLELYGIRGISRVAEGRMDLEHTIPLAHRNRGDRYLRVTADGGDGVHGYGLELSVGP